MGQAWRANARRAVISDKTSVDPVNNVANAIASNAAKSAMSQDLTGNIKNWRRARVFSFRRTAHQRHALLRPARSPKHVLCAPAGAQTLKKMGVD